MFDLDRLVAAERAIVARMRGDASAMAPRQHGPRAYPTLEDRPGSAFTKYWSPNYRQPVISTSLPGTYKRYELFSTPVSATSNSLIVSVPPGTIWRIVSIKCVVTTDATVGNRAVSLCFMPNGGVLSNSTLVFVAQSNLLQGPSIGAHQTWMTGGQDAPTVNPTWGMGPLPEHFIVYENAKFQVFVNPQNVGDSVSFMEAYVEEWVTYTR